MATAEPVLLIGFNRPDHLAQVIEVVRSAAPPRVYLAVDGPRPGRPEEAERVARTRDLRSRIDWTDDVRTLFQPSNLGCGAGVTAAISWFFATEERGIILEDDILPEPDFFNFCSQLLERYSSDERVFAISGCNYVPSGHQSHPMDSYRFSQVPHIWGWATWRRSWLRHRLDIADWRERVPMRMLVSRSEGSLPAAVYWATTFTLLGRGEIDTWDGQLVLASMEHAQLTATSNVNLVRNIGFGPEATHTFEDRGYLQPTGSLHQPLVHPAQVAVDRKAERWTQRHHFHATWRGMAGQALRYLDRRGGAA